MTTATPTSTAIRLPSRNVRRSILVVLALAAAGLLAGLMANGDNAPVSQASGVTFHTDSVTTANLFEARLAAQFAHPNRVTTAAPSIAAANAFEARVAEMHARNQSGLASSQVTDTATDVVTTANLFEARLAAVEVSG